MLHKNDKLWLGLLVGLIVPALGYFLALQSNDWISAAINRSFSFKSSTIALIAICFNMIPLGYFRRRLYHHALRGLLVVTMLLTVVWFLKFGLEII